MRQHTNQPKKNFDFISRTFYRPDTHCCEQGSWFFTCIDQGEVGPFDSREEAKDALQMSLLLNAKKRKSKPIH